MNRAVALAVFFSVLVAACSGGDDGTNDATSEGATGAEGAVAAGTIGPVGATTTTSIATTTTPPEPIRMLVAGDSYSAGEGLQDAQGRCARSRSAYGPLVGAELADRGRLDTLLFAACTAAATTDWPQQHEELIDDPPNVIVATFGGNDAGFVELMADCIGVDDGAEILEGSGDLDLESATELLFGRGCDMSDEEIESRLDALRPRLEVLYQDMADLVGPDGHVFILGYPAPLADPDDWPGRRCEGVSGSDALVLRRAAEQLNQVIADSAGLVDNVHMVAVAEEFAGHGRCGPEPWLFGLADALGSSSSPEERLSLRLTRPFHPNAEGHRAMARLLLAAIDAEIGPS